MGLEAQMEDIRRYYIVITDPKRKDDTDIYERAFKSTVKAKQTIRKMQTMSRVWAEFEYKIVREKDLKKDYGIY